MIKSNLISGLLVMNFDEALDFYTKMWIRILEKQSGEGVDNWIRRIKIAIRSLVSQCDHRINLYCFAGRKVTSQQRHKHQEQDNRPKRQRVSWAHAEQQVLHQTRQCHRDQQTDPRSQRRQFHPLEEHQLQYPAGLRAERHPQADLARALADGV